MAAFASGSYLLDLPVEILDLILSYLSDVDLINVRKVSVQFEEAFQRLICRQGRKLNFSTCYHLREEELIEVLELGRDYITSVNVNHCYWLTPDCMELIMKLPKLQELHMIDCDISSLLLKRLIPVGLSALSLHWGFGAFARIDDEGNEYASQLAGNMKRLTIDIRTETNLNYTMDYLAATVLTHCLQLETLEVYKYDPWLLGEPVLFMEEPFQCSEGLLPKLSKLSVQLNAVTSIPRWLKAIFMQRKTPLSEVCLAKASYWLLESDPESVELILPSIIAGETPVVCLDSGDLRCRELPAIPKIWMNRKTPKCKVVLFQRLTLTWISDTSKLVAEIGPQFQELSIRNCHVDMSDLFMGLTTISKHCTQLIKLDLTLNSSVKTNDDSNKLLIAVSEFKALKALYMSVDLLSSSKNMPRQVPGHQNSRVGSQMEISEESMRSSEIWRLTQSCMEIEDFRLTDWPCSYDVTICESALACISNWKKLKELHLIDIHTLGQGRFLPFITKNCPQLKNLYLANVCQEGTCRYMTSLVECLSYATNLKDLSIIQDIELSLVLSNALGKCLSLERVFFQSLVMKPEVCGGFIKLVSELPKLVLVWVETKSTTKTVIKSIVKELKSVKSTWPSFIYCLTHTGTELPAAPVKTYTSFPGDSMPRCKRAPRLVCVAIKQH